MPPWTCLELPQCLKLIQETVDRRKDDENRLYIFILDFVNHQFSKGGFLFCICLKLVGKHVQLSALCMESPHGESESDMVQGTSGAFCPKPNHGHALVPMVAETDLIFLYRSSPKLNSRV